MSKNIGFIPISSGSKGNVIYFNSGEISILIDVGISTKQLETKLEQLSVNPHEIKGILITHEHSDHIAGIQFAQKYQIPLICNSETAKAILSEHSKVVGLKIFTTGEEFSFYNLRITPFSVQHDTADPVAFRIEVGSIAFGFCTDLGCVTTLVKEHLKGCRALYIESNHEPSMVMACSRPQVYKTRVLSRLGHLSNDSACELLASLLHPDLSKVYLAHLSEECNNPNLALEKAKKVCKDLCHVEIAWQDTISSPCFFTN